MFDVYQHKKLPQYRVIVPKGNPFPAEGNEQDWRLAKTVEQIWPEAQEQINGKGYYLYKPVVTFREM
jgi:hypothetical protein